MKKDIKNIDDIKVMVDGFYTLVREDELIGPIFNQVIDERWPEHLGKMYRFWQTVLFQEHTYRGRPFPPHIKLPVEHQHFERWVELFRQNLTSHFKGPRADEAMWRAEKMATLFEHKIKFHRSHGIHPLI